MNPPDIRVEKGNAEPEEVAAITAILLARAASRPTETPSHRGRVRAGWRRLERENGFRAPHSWR
ncbi:acyl-CoA carboxylase subunit epsilon [Streptomyces acidiscabies]|uniref:Acyl-CoA carboxylase subunit epsilon n=1 Tax=Streptomyces acidiscabies TaxID=42234 RepID=A0AAP6BG16_9ACTN|nr:acyl-CoA carboxylase subunit epsilon [Streptomyces acidiscabies]MBP5936600.1 acyl-CoA carboxylase subunit epsilon [Streptomyces sp. LBUM 1476]MBZ3915404.1 acyl-CoA carboxylase subunit epsilon [Streptomyces acidiscabies]MDX2964047.1 acyl-CoA carboxylase subunit epsilon [Streptomyces acidiscabies]MDX3022399.1 acyl-CoA carboxylase subunit epsilon [Streptomyces acidiscabies]MDX3794401.1 acyl-CoA carboxylase subunit epsilon [Streptomyces acidiscabies]